MLGLDLLHLYCSVVQLHIESLPVQHLKTLSSCAIILNVYIAASVKDNEFARNVYFATLL